MKLPNIDQAIIPLEKLRDYLLSPTHPVGKFKAVFFRTLGYTDKNWHQLELSIRSLLKQDAFEGERTNFGQKYEIRGTIVGPSGRQANIITIWIIRRKEDVPRFITAYPGG